MKKTAKKIVVAISWRIVAKLFAHKEFKIVAVAGSIGKTGTKRAIATVLGQKYKVQWQDGNYNDISSVPLIFFGLPMPQLTNPIAWAKTFSKMNRSIPGYDYEVVVLELGTDAPGQIAEFSKYLKVDVGVVTPIAPEHMEYFKTLDKVAEEELSLQAFSKELVISEDNVNYANLISDKYKTYGQDEKSTVRVEMGAKNPNFVSRSGSYEAKAQLLGLHQLKNLAAAALVAEILDLDKTQIQEGLASVTPMAGRMQLLKGINNSTIIDDTYNSSPEAVKAALVTLYDQAGTHKIAVLGNMNEMGELSAELHQQVGEYCDPDQLDLVITIGADANHYLASAAKARGCEVITSQSPYEIGDVLKNKLNSGAVVLLKGSQNGVFLEEAIKPLLENPDDEARLVRQTPEWLAKKRKMFGQ